MHTRVVAATAVVLVLAVAAGLVTWRLLSTRSTYEDALATLPKATLRTTFTDWQVVREKARGTRSTPGRRARRSATSWTAPTTST